MKLKSFFMVMATTGLILSCTPTEQKSDVDSKNLGEAIGKSKIKVENGIMTPEVLYSFGRIGSVEVSPDKSRVLYQVTYVDIKENKTNTELFVINTDGSDKKQLTVTNARESNPQWISNGKKIAFLSNESGSSQIWVMNPDGSGMKRITDVEEGIDGFIFSPDNKKVLFIKSVKSLETVKERYPDLPKASGRIVDDLMYKHWDSWVEQIPHVFLADVSDDKLTNIVDLLQDEPYEAPMLPFGGIEQLAWSPDGKTIAYTSRKKTGKEYALSTNSDIYFYDVESGKTTNMTEGMMGYDVNPQFSPDGTKLAWQSMERDGYESDKNRLFVMDLATGEKNYVTEHFDYNTDAFVWNTDNKTIYLVACVEAKTQLFSADIQSKEITPITKGKHDYATVALGNGKLIAKTPFHVATRRDICR
jgi:Tol biopolymer transport system component